MISITHAQIDDVLLRLEKPMGQYLWIQNEFCLRDVRVDKEFQRKFNAFYRVRRNAKWQNAFYNLFEESKKTEVNFTTILGSMHSLTGRYEASFASKLAATLDPDLPIIDSVVFKNLNLRLPTRVTPNRLGAISNQHVNVKREFQNFLESKNGIYLIRRFLEEYPEAKVSDIKKLDFILWQLR